MRIGILTFHRSVNNGAVMQCYSLCKKLKQKFPDVNIEVVDYNMKKIEKQYSPDFFQYILGDTLLITLKKICHFFINNKMLKCIKIRKNIFENSIAKLDLSPEKIIDDEQNKIRDYINSRYDILIVGSDAVWNYCSRGFPNIYFPDKRVKCLKLSYAASCYGMEYLSYSKNERKTIEEVLNEFYFIGVRDAATEDFVKWSGCTITPIHTCDPTIFLDVNDLPIDNEKLIQKMSDRGFDFNKPTIGLMGNEKMLKMVRHFYGDKYQIVSLYNYVRGADVQLYDIEPFEWAYVFRYFKLTFTTYFHGTLLSLRNGVPVICFALNTQFAKKHLPKTLDVLTRLGFNEWYFKTDYISENFDNIKSKADELLSHDYSKKIIDAVECEAKTFENFEKNLKTLINGKRNING